MFIKVPPGYLSPAFGRWGQIERGLCGCVFEGGEGGMDVGVAVKGQYAISNKKIFFLLVSDKDYTCAC